MGGNNVKNSSTAFGLTQYVLVAFISQKLDFVQEKTPEHLLLSKTLALTIYLVHSQNHTVYYLGNQGEVLGIRSVYRH